jgi:two-component system, NtrC family, sensor kinase
LIECYASQINQVFMHLIGNALDALKDIALKDIALKDIALKDIRSSEPFEKEEKRVPTLHISTAVVNEHRVAIWIIDNGCGISPEIQERIFDPFFTTKEIGEGTGLGLSISHQIVSVQHGGTLKCYSVPGQGTKFLVELPLQLVRCEKMVDTLTVGQLASEHLNSGNDSRDQNGFVEPMLSTLPSLEPAGL